MPFRLLSRPGVRALLLLSLSGAGASAVAACVGDTDAIDPNADAGGDASSALGDSGNSQSDGSVPSTDGSTSANDGSSDDAGPPPTATGTLVYANEFVPQVFFNSNLVAFDEAGGIFVAGYYQTGPYDLGNGVVLPSSGTGIPPNWGFIAKFDANGVAQWGRSSEDHQWQRDSERHPQRGQWRGRVLCERQRHEHPTRRRLSHDPRGRRHSHRTPRQSGQTSLAQFVRNLG